MKDKNNNTYAVFLAGKSLANTRDIANRIKAMTGASLILRYYDGNSLYKLNSNEHSDNNPYPIVEFNLNEAVKVQQLFYL
ncbi:MAG: hypothetical protein MZU97_02455 [Bacillus subtilis]|nr:hypothetical protein [Bacillus subtilis]